MAKAKKKAPSKTATKKKAPVKAEAVTNEDNAATTDPKNDAVTDGAHLVEDTKDLQYPSYTGHKLPPRSFGGGGANPYDFDRREINSAFFVDAYVDPDLYASPKEAEAAQSEELRKVSNRLTGAVRRFRKHHPERKFTVRHDKHPETGKACITVMRVA